MNQNSFKLLIISLLLFTFTVSFTQVDEILRDHYAQYDVNYYNIDLKVSNVSTYLNGSTRIHFTVNHNLDSLSLELSNLLNVETVTLKEDEIDFTHSEHLITVYSSLSTGIMYELEISYEGTGGNEFFSGVFNREAPFNRHVTYTLSEPYGAKFWFPCKQDLKDKIDSVQLSLTCPDSVKAVSIGMLDTIVPLPGNKKQYVWKSNYPISYYLPAFTVGDFMNYSQMVDVQGTEMLFENYIYNDPGYYQEQKANIDTTVYLLNLFSEMFGEYPFIKEKYGHVTAPIGGGMEHQTMTTLKHFGFYLVAHELAHQWFGNQVTCGQWNDIWLNEGFASYSEYLAIENLPDKQIKADWLEREFTIASRDYTMSIHVPEIELDNPFRIFNSATTYARGAVMLHMMRNIMDDDDSFSDILQVYINRYSNSTAVFDDFKQVVEEVSGTNWDVFFDQWYYGHGYPVYNIFYRQHNDSVHLTSLQLENDTAQFFEMPLVIQIQEEDTTYTRTVYHNAQRQESAFPLFGELVDIVVDPDRNYLQYINLLTRLAGNANDLVYKLYPNPVEDQLNIAFSPGVDEPLTLEIFSNDGHKVYEQRNILSKAQYQLHVGNLSQGIYYLHILYGNQAESHPFVKL